MIITTSEKIEGKTIVKTIGLVKGSTIRARHLGRDIMAGLRGVVGGEISEYTKMLAESREQALRRMEEEAEPAAGVWGVSHAESSLKEKRVSERQEKTAERLLTQYMHVPARVDAQYGPANSAGSGIVLWARTGASVIGASALGKLGKPSEQVAEEAVERLVREAAW